MNPYRCDLYGFRASEGEGVQGEGRAPEPTEGGDEEEGASGERTQVHGYVLPTADLLLHLQGIHLVGDVSRRDNLKWWLLASNVLRRGGYSCRAFVDCPCPVKDITINMSRRKYITLFCNVHLVYSIFSCLSHHVHIM